MGEPDTTVLEHLRAIREQLDIQGTRFLELIKRLGNLEVQVAGISEGLDSVDGRLDRIERRLSLVETKL